MEEEMNRFIRGQRVLQIEKELVRFEGAAHWSFCVEYLDGGKPSSSPALTGGRVKETIDWRERLSEEQFLLFSALRDKRKWLAAKEGIKAYMVATNAHLGQIVEEKISTLAELKKMRGFGDAKLEKYGEALLAVAHAEESGKSD